MGSAYLFHGPKARESAIRYSESKGRPLLPPIGTGGLGVKASREISEILSSIPIGTSLGMIVIGPMDDASSEASDALLKTFEEFDSRYVCPVLWAADEGGVPATIRSRCLRVWCPADPGFSPEAPFLKIAEGICEAAIRQRIASVIEHLAEQTGYEAEVVRASVEVLTRREDWPVEERLKLWGRLRDALGSHYRAERPLTPLAVLSAFLGA